MTVSGLPATFIMRSPSARPPDPGGAPLNGSVECRQKIPLNSVISTSYGEISKATFRIPPEIAPAISYTSTSTVAQSTWFWSKRAWSKWISSFQNLTASAATDIGGVNDQHSRGLIA
jgi:hypothetical protein